MSYFRSCLNIIIVALVLSGCQTLSTADINAVTQSELDRIELPEASDRLEQLFLRQLDTSLNQQAGLRDLALSIDMSVTSSSTLAVKGKTSSLSKSVLSVEYVLSDRLHNDILTQGTVTATATSGTVSSYFGQEQSKIFASERLALTLADRLTQKLRLYFLSSSQKQSSSTSSVQ